MILRKWVNCSQKLHIWRLWIFFQTILLVLRQLDWLSLISKNIWCPQVMLEICQHSKLPLRLKMGFLNSLAENRSMDSKFVFNRSQDLEACTWGANLKNWQESSQDQTPRSVNLCHNLFNSRVQLVSKLFTMAFGSLTASTQWEIQATWILSAIRLY